MPTIRPTELPTNVPTPQCGLTERQRRNAIEFLIIARGISSFESVNDTGSPQNLAMNWIIDFDTRHLCPSDPDLDRRYSLAAFYYSTRGDRWDSCLAPEDFSDPVAIEEANARCSIPIAQDPQEQIPLDSGSDAWLTPSEECAWMGVVCGEDDSVQWLQVSENGLTGGINSELGQLTDLRILRLEDGVITAPLPDIFGQLSELRILNLRFQLIEGGIPPSIYGLANLEELILDNNRLEGQISPDIGRILNLRKLSLNANPLTGEIPDGLGSASLLEEATFDETFLSGDMPDSVCTLRDEALRVLTADCVDLGGPFVTCDCCTNEECQ